MEPTLDINQRILVNRFVYHFTDPKPGDVVVFHPPAGVENGGANGNGCGVRAGSGQPCPEATAEKSGDTFIKRIVAGPGDTISVEGGLPVVNGEVVRAGWLRDRALRTRRPGLQPARGDHHSRRPLLHDGRQPRPQ